MHGEGTRDALGVVGARVREARERCGMGIRTLSVLSDVPEAALVGLERGTSSVKTESLLRVARALGVPVTALFE